MHTKRTIFNNSIANIP